MKPLLSIVVPTKNRYEYLTYLVDLFLSIPDDRIELIVQDNSDTQSIEFLDKLEKNYDKRIKYFYNSEHISIVENCDKAILNSTGDYVSMIGDDDGFIPNIVEVTEWMKENRFNALRSYKPTYYWPGQQSNYLSNDSTGVLEFKDWKDDSYQSMSTKEGLMNTLKKGGTTMANLPCVYHGIVKRSILNEIFLQTKSFFPGPSPDMANAIALTQVIDSFIYTNYPIFISGVSPKSAGGSGVMHKHIAKIEDVKHLPIDTVLCWDKRVPKYWTGSTIYAESVIKTLEAFNNIEALKAFNYNYLYAWISIFNMKHAKKIFSNFIIKRSISFHILRLKIFIYRAKVFLIYRLNKKIKLSHIMNINMAVEKISKYKCEK